ncbi:MAG: imidazolonepropionase [Acidobacteria bacterium]|nr:MAG: imidazolonepropionase [Acidobacteriota bacterium]
MILSYADCYTVRPVSSSPDKHQRPRALLLANIGQLLTLRSPAGKQGPRRGGDLNELGVIEDAAILCVAGKIVFVNKMREALRDPWVASNRKKIDEVDCRGRVVLPGFVDSHTHPVFMQPRLVDFEKRISGASYEQIAEAGGGIRSSLKAVRRATRRQLADGMFDALRRMAEQGTTTVEAKSGYGLNAESELKSLQAIAEAAKRWPGTVVPTLLGAHVIPQEFEDQGDEYVDLVCREMIPAAAKKKLARFADVFTERGAFSLEQTEKIFVAARQHGLGVRAHVGQLSRTPLSILLRFKVASLDHLDHVTEDDIRQLAQSDCVATLVPGANYFLGLADFAPARKLIDAGVAVALATDYNPGSSPTVSMPFVLSMACTRMRMSPAEAVSAATINAAWGLRLQDRKGSVEPGKDADLALFDVRDYREIAYWFGENRCLETVMNGLRQTEASG